MKSIIHALILCFFAITASAQSTVLVDFGNISSPAPWNNLSDTKNGAIINLVNTFGITTNISVEVIDSFTGINTNGTQTPSMTLGFQSTATQDSYFGNTIPFSGETQPTGGIRFSNLDTSMYYSFTVFASRMASDNRETQYVLSGKTNDTAFLNVSNNTSTTIVFSAKPNQNGNIDMIASPGPNNNNNYGFFYLGSIMMQYQDSLNIIDEMEVLNPNGGEFWQIGKNVKINWKTTIQQCHLLEYSTDNGISWSLIDTMSKFQYMYDWNVPSPPSSQCLVRIRTDSLEDSSDNVFEISSSTDSCSIVILGSSTAAGAGASVSDSSWVNRFKSEVYENDTRCTITNLAKGGYTTYHLLPDANALAGNVGITIDTLRNITKALSLAPSGIIINLPSNDAAYNFSAHDQMENYRIIVDEALQQGVKVWISTPQPRNFSNQAQIQIQLDTKDSILAVYGIYSIDFWNGMVDSNGHIVSFYDSGDGVHLNDAGHGELFHRVMDKKIIDSLCDFSSAVIEYSDYKKQFNVVVYPNPFKKSFMLKMDVEAQGFVEINLYDLSGKKLFEAKVDIDDENQVFKFTPDIPDGIHNQLLLLKMRINQYGDYMEKSVLLMYID